MEQPDRLSDEIKILEERKAHLEKVKSGYLQAQHALPFVQQNIDITDWQIRVYKNLPTESAEIPRTIDQDKLASENQYLQGLFKIPDVPSDLALYSGTAITISGSSDDYAYINRVKDLGTQSAVEFGDMFIEEYHHLQDIQQRPRQVRALLEKIKSKDVLERFDTACEAYMAFRGDAARRTAVANEMRNLLLAFKGDLFNLARKFPKENMTWNTMSARLAINSGAGIEHVTLSSQNLLHSSLLSRLADVLKDREGGSITDLNVIWVEILDHIYTVLGLIKN